MDLKSPRVIHPFGFTQAPHWVPDVASKMTQRQNTRHTRDRQDTLRPEEQNCAKLIAVYYYKSPLGRIPDCMNKPFSVQRRCIHVIVQQRGVKSMSTAESVQALISFLSQEGNAPSFAGDH